MKRAAVLLLLLGCDETLAQLPPTVSDWAVSIYAGDITYVEAAVFGDELKLIKAVPVRPLRTLAFSAQGGRGAGERLENRNTRGSPLVSTTYQAS
ncbi:MAG TPA: hypothetical protein VH083_15865 [Myxococcales bacterium]|nr:hypothetical protein [Myxococcales bacterium]